MGELEVYLNEHRDSVYLLLRHYLSLQRPYLLQSDLWDEFETFCTDTHSQALCDTTLAHIIRISQEALLDAPWCYLALRPRIGRWLYLRFHTDTKEYHDIGISEFLQFKERIKQDNGEATPWALEVDLGPFNREFPKLQESRSIGRGVEFLNRRLSSQLFEELGKGDKGLLHFLRVHQCQGQQLMLNDRISDVPGLRQALRRADDYLAIQQPSAEWDSLGHSLQQMGFEPGWGRSTEQIRASLNLLTDILEAPAPEPLERFLGNMPMIFKLAIISPHGYFGQSQVRGLPDTGGQVVYILDQVRALEKEMSQRIHAQGLDIKPEIVVITRLIPEAEGTRCNQPLEPIMGTENARILRVPFHNERGEVIPQWISRFEIWPYLERFTEDVRQALLAELGCRPDLIIGNYSDGNLVASLLAQELHITQCNIAHALEKTKYLYADLYWEENEADYHFSSQFTADLIAMNSADFIITSTYQEIAGTRESVGQYESYMAYTLPSLYRVVNGVDIFDPKFNIVSPGADSEVYFPYSDQERRLSGLHMELDNLVFGEARQDSRGVLVEKGKPLLFTMARLDHIKNITGLVQWYAESAELRDCANLLVIAGHIHPDDTQDTEERAQIEHMHELFEQHQLDAQVRWLGLHLDKHLAGELYRYVADRQGAFVQPALFEAFGLTVIEAMSSGLPTFATCYGGPLEIIKDGISGYHIDPNHGAASAGIMSRFFRDCKTDPGHWHSISRAALERIESRYTWSRYANRLLTLSCIYGFWKYVTNLERDETRRYLEMFYGLQYRPLARGVLEQHAPRG